MLLIYETFLCCNQNNGMGKEKFAIVFDQPGNGDDGSTQFKEDHERKWQLCEMVVQYHSIYVVLLQYLQRFKKKGKHAANEFVEVFVTCQ